MECTIWIITLLRSMAPWSTLDICLKKSEVDYEVKSAETAFRVLYQRLRAIREAALIYFTTSLILKTPNT